MTNTIPANLTTKPGGTRHDWLGVTKPPWPNHPETLRSTQLTKSMAQPPIHLFATWKVKQGHAAEVLRLLQQMVPRTRAEKGNLFYDVHQGIADDHTIVLYEGYVDEAALQAHRDADYFKEWVLGKIVPLLESRGVVLTHPLN